jgi:hypothetical protein
MAAESLVNSNDLNNAGRLAHVNPNRRPRRRGSLGWLFATVDRTAQLPVSE